MDTHELSRRFPRSEKYTTAWVQDGGMGSHPLWMAEWLSERLNLQSGIRVLDLGCGRARSSIFLAQELDRRHDERRLDIMVCLTTTDRPGQHRRDCNSGGGRWALLDLYPPDWPPPC
jgi:hypothetical protein